MPNGLMEAQGSGKKISVLIPVRNEERYIDNCCESLLKQKIDFNNLEVFFIDGMSKDKTAEIISKYVTQYRGIFFMLFNEKKTVPYAMNIGIKASHGEYIIRLDAHSTYSDDYIAKCIDVLEETGADNVGGIIKTISHGYIGNAIANMLETRFGVGNSKFRVGAKDGYVDTVPFGAFRRNTFIKYGYYDERLTRNQDIELNYRIRDNGGKIYLSSKIKLSYYSRDTIIGLVKMAFRTGYWIIRTSKFCNRKLSLRHYIPFFFVITLILGLIFQIFFRGNIKETVSYIWWIAIIAYLILDLYFSVSISISKGFKFFPIQIFLYPIFHISYGLGSLFGLISILLP